MLGKIDVKKTGELFRSRLDSIISLEHALVKLSSDIDWSKLEAEFLCYYKETGRPAHHIRRMCGLLFLKDFAGLSDERLCASWLENPYYQYFCGEEYFQTEFKIDSGHISQFRYRIGEAGLERLLEETIKVGLKRGVIKKSDLKLVTADTTVQEKAITFPTDTKSYSRAIGKVVDMLKGEGVNIRQSYKRQRKKLLFESSKLYKARKFGQAKRKTTQLHNILGRLIREAERKLPAESLSGNATLQLAKRFYDLNDKIYSWHEPDVECIGKGKAHKKWEFGCLSSIVATTKTNFIVGAKSFDVRIHDSKTLKPALAQVEQLTKVKPQKALLDLGYRGCKSENPGIDLIICGAIKNPSKHLKKLMKRRSAIEPIIAHTKLPSATGRNHLKGKLGDKINIISLAIGFNLRKITNFLCNFLQKLQFYIFSKMCSNFINIEHLKNNPS